METWLGVDFGTELVGIAVGTTLLGSGRPLTSIPAEPAGDMWRALDKLEAEWRPHGYAVGLALLLDGSEQPISVLTRAFAAELASRTGKPVQLVDERASTLQAKRMFAEKRALGQARRKQAQAVDAWAAAVILERYFAGPSESS